MPPRANLRAATEGDSTETIPPAEIVPHTGVTPADVAEGGSRLRAIKIDRGKAVSAVRKPNTSNTPPNTMMTLHALFGERVIEIFPQEFRQAIDDCYEFWKEHPDSYLPMECESEKERAEILVCMRAYGDIAPNGPYTIRTLADPDPRMLVWRAQNRRATGTSSDSEGS